ncbi:hypothetical protein FRC17_008714, partial [Serendipita sp. 399]
MKISIFRSQLSSELTSYCKGESETLKAQRSHKKNLSHIEEGISKDKLAISASTIAISNLQATLAYSREALESYQRNLDAMNIILKTFGDLSPCVRLELEAETEPESSQTCRDALDFISNSTKEEFHPLQNQQTRIKDKIHRLTTIIASLEQDLADWELGLRLSQSSLGHLQQCFDEITSVLLDYTSALSAKHYLPTEVWTMIFLEWVKSRDAKLGHLSRPSPLLLSQVCRRWREMVQNSSQLWRRVDIYPTSWSPRHVTKYQELVVQFGGINVIDIKIDIGRHWSWEEQARDFAGRGSLCVTPDPNRYYYHESLWCPPRSDLVLASCGAITVPYSLCICASKVDEQELERLKCVPFLSPSSLTVKAILCINSNKLLSILELFKSSKRLVLTNIAPQGPNVPSILPNLTHLEVNMRLFISYDLSSLLRPTLEDLRLHFRDHTRLFLTRDGSDVNLPKLQTLGMSGVGSSVTRRLVAPSVTKLVLYGAESSPYSNELPLVSWIRLPEIKQLVFEDWFYGEDNLDPIVAFRELSSHMTYLSNLEFHRCLVDGRVLIGHAEASIRTGSNREKARYHYPWILHGHHAGRDEKSPSSVEDEWTKPLTSLFGLDEPVEKEDESAQQSAGLGWKGLNFIKESFRVDSIPSLTASWIWPESIANMRAQIQALMVAVGRGPGSLYEQIVEEASKSPEVSWDAHVRLGDDLCVAERAFLRERKRRMKHAFANFIGVSEREVKEEDIPVIAIAASGGGYRAMTNTAGSLIGAKESGLLDCIAYIAGISGSCWALGVLYSGLPGRTSLPDPSLAAEHIKDRVSKDFFDT